MDAIETAYSIGMALDEKRERERLAALRHAGDRALIKDLEDRVQALEEQLRIVTARLIKLGVDA